MKTLTDSQRRGIIIMIFKKEIFSDISFTDMQTDISFLRTIIDRGKYTSDEGAVLNYYRLKYNDVKERERNA